MCEISIVIPTLNRYDCLKNTIKDLYNQSVQNFEIIIIDQTDRNKAQKVIGDKICYILQKEKSASKARNKGLVISKAKIVLFIDDDVIIENKDFLKNHIKHYTNPKNSGVSGATLSMDNKFCDTLPKKVLKKHIGWMFFPGNYNKPYIISNGRSCNLSVRKSFALAIGGMDERFDKGAYREESDFCLRLTKKYGKLIYDPDCYLIHIGNTTGGIRSWTSSKGIIHTYQHMFGSWYFMFKNLPLYTWFEYSWYMLRRFILHKKLIHRFYLIPYAGFKYIIASFEAAYFSLKKPLTLN
jgi:glycosyltransferase involved in cell wall biosynthesis